MPLTNLLRRTGFALIMTLSVNSFAGGISSSGVPDPKIEQFMQFTQNPAVIAQVKALRAQGYMAEEPRIVAISGQQVGQQPGYSSRQVVFYLITQSFFPEDQAKSGDFRVIGTTMTSDNYNHVPGVESLSDFKLLDEAKIKSLLEFLKAL